MGDEKQYGDRRVPMRSVGEAEAARHRLCHGRNKNASMLRRSFLLHVPGGSGRFAGHSVTEGGSNERVDSPVAML